MGERDHPDGTAAPAASDERPSRRGFLTATVAAAAGGIAAGAAGMAAVQAAGPGQGVPAPTGSATLRPDGLGFEHLVVVMFENRSFDNLLGYLYDGPDGTPTPDGQRFEGLQGAHANTAPDGTVVPAHPYEGATDAIMRSPDPDPGEEYPFVNTQLFGTVDPTSNRHHDLAKLTAPYNAPADGRSPDMSGFVVDYVDKFRAEHRREPSAAEAAQIMGAFTPAMLPVFSTLARSFALYDHWHCAVPSQTFPNRSFFHASSSHGFVTNGGGDGGYAKWLDPAANRATTIFNRLQDAGVDWAVYYDDRQLISLTGLLHAPQLEPYWQTNFHTMSTFHRQVADGTLPAYAFIEPRLLYDHNDLHPPVGPATRLDLDGSVIEGGGISDVRAGDALLHELYTAIRTSPATTGSTPLNTALLVTFDEHGGTYDHVPPPAATPPHPQDGTEMGFGFDRLGVRVPALLVSAWSPAAVVNDEMHHGSLVASLCARFGLDPLNARDDGAPTIANGLTLASPRDPSTWPTTFPAYVPRNPESDDPIHPGQHEHPLSPPGVGLMSMLIAKYGAPGEPVPRTYREAWEAVRTHGQGLFGT